VQSSQSALLQETSFLSSRNSELEERLMKLENSAVNIEKLETENTILLNLLGEKQEELELTLADIKEVKFLYRTELDQLYGLVAPPKIPDTDTSHNM
jgi:hypothetical protein